MQVEIDFEVFKALTVLRESEADSYNAVIRRLLKLPVGIALEQYDSSEAFAALEKSAALVQPRPLKRGSLFGAQRGKSTLAPDAVGSGILGRYLSGAWFGNVQFPEGTKFRATYKGETHLAEVKGGQWMGADGLTRSSPSDAASAISGTNVNGWRFWYAQMPGDPSWRRMDEFKA